MSPPAVDRMFITSVWLQCIIYGAYKFNCVLFGVCMYVIFIRNKSAHWIVPLSCIFHFSMATVHIIISFLYALQGLTDPAVISVPYGSTLYFASVTALWSTMTGLYLFNVLVLHFLLIWRFYLVWNRNLVATIILLILEVGHLATALAAWGMVTHSREIDEPIALHVATALFILNIVLTIYLTSGIAYRLWRAGADTFDLTGHNAYKPAIYTIIQCGALYTSSIVVICILRLSGKPAGLVAPYVGIQFATLTPLLLIVSLKFGVRHDQA
ncbi:uncharacterized protein F5891DRAFT_1013668 [Suillus fuscotomentosus]|uniref:Uncharacterized protein n=1 Tax=Suillus fuscotomentosus TaxID=1912939 RepID=A0AAD4EDZ2_9AGAM|nr:uncharacterized protein F5891DRAFT_1013668 [Suillus fuscotomentosus]KAG1904262.1 hypothetical protein F5891DRAFT_1013668 [Suillus fuscotomentosus]